MQPLHRGQPPLEMVRAIPVHERAELQDGNLLGIEKDDQDVLNVTDMGISRRSAPGDNRHHQHGSLVILNQQSGTITRETGRRRRVCRGRTSIR